MNTENALTFSLITFVQSVLDRGEWFH